MKNQNTLIAIVTTFVALILCYFIPEFTHMATSQRTRSPLYYYSSKIKELCRIDYSNEDAPVLDMSGNAYTEQQADTILPLFNSRQLFSDGMMPDSIDGHEITPQILSAHAVIEFYRPRNVNTPNVGLTAILESMPVRVGLKQPDDFFRYDDRFEFIDAQSNSIDHTKSELFDKALEKAGYTFPTQWVVGDASVRKPYDEGYFCFDSKGELFHVKLVNGRPFVKNTNVSQHLKVDKFIMHLSRNKRFYGFIIDDQGGVHILESDNQGGYNPLRLDIDNINAQTDSFRVMGNLLYWNILVTTPSENLIYALKSDDLNCVARHSEKIEPQTWDYLSQWLLPVYITFEGPMDSYFHTRVKIADYKAFALSGVLAIGVLLLLLRKHRRSYAIFSSLLVLLTGAAGLLAVLIMPKFNK